jgi:hypothetical protein
MVFSLMSPSKVARYAIGAVFLGLVAVVCAEAVVGKDLGLLTPEEIEDNLQVLSIWDLTTQILLLLCHC